MAGGPYSTFKCVLWGAYGIFRNEEILYQGPNLQNILKNQPDKARS